jgi:hypothetical protein
MAQVRALVREGVLEELFAGLQIYRSRRFPVSISEAMIA